MLNRTFKAALVAGVASLGLFGSAQSLTPEQMRVLLGGAHRAAGLPQGTVAAITVNNEGWTANVALAGLGTGGTYALNPDTASPKLDMTVTRFCYDTSGNATTCTYHVLGTLPKRVPYPSNTAAVEVSASGLMTTTIALSDYILPSDTITANVASGLYTDTGSHASLAATNLAVTNWSAATEDYPIGQWVTASSQRWADSSSFTAEFAAFSRFPRNGSQVKVVRFIASDGTHTVTKTATAMALSTQQLTTACTSTQGSPILSCSNTKHWFVGERVTAVPYTSTYGDGTSSMAKSLALGAEPAISAITASASITLKQAAFTASASAGTLSVTAIASGSLWVGMYLPTSAGFTAGVHITSLPGGCTGAKTACNATGSYGITGSDTVSSQAMTDAAGSTGNVELVLGAPIYDYQATFSSGDQASLNAGAVTIEAIAYPNLGSLTLDTAHAYAGPYSTTCTLNTGNVASAALTSCGSITGFNYLDHVTVTGVTDTALNNNDLYIYATPSGGQIQLDVTPATSTAATVTISEGLPSNIVSPNLKNLAVYNDKGSAYGAACAWVLSTGTAASAVLNTTIYTGSGCATAPSGTTTHYFASKKAAAQYLASYNNSTYSHNDACGSTIFISGSFTDSVSGANTYIVTLCPIPTTIAADPALVTANTPPTLTAYTTAGNNDFGYSTVIQDLILTSATGAKTVIQEGDSNTVNGNGPAVRKAHVVLQNSEALEGLSSSCGPLFYRVGWFEYRNSYLAATSCDDSAVTASSTGNSFDYIGSYLETKTVQILDPYIVMGNITSSFDTLPVNHSAAAYVLPPSSNVFAFNKMLNYSGEAFAFSGESLTPNPVAKNNLVIAQQVTECTGTTSTTPCTRIKGDDTYLPVWNNLLESYTSWGGRSNLYYDNRAAASPLTDAFALWEINYNDNTKDDNFANPIDYAISNNTPAVSGGSACNGDGVVTFPAPTGSSLAQGGVTQTATEKIAAGALTGANLINDGTGLEVNGIGYANATLTGTVSGDSGATCNGATLTYSTAKLATTGSGMRVANWAFRYGVGHIGRVAGTSSDAANATLPDAFAADYYGLAGNTSNNLGFGQQSFTWMSNASNSAALGQNTGGGGNNTGLGWYKPSTTTGLTSRVPSGLEPFPGDLDGIVRKNDGTGCAGAYEC